MPNASGYVVQLELSDTGGNEKCYKHLETNLAVS